MQEKDKTGTGKDAADAKPDDGEATLPAGEPIEGEAVEVEEDRDEKDAPWSREGADTLVGDDEPGSEPAEPIASEPLPEAETPRPESETAAPPERRSSPLVGTVGIVLLALMAAVVGAAIGPHLLGTQEADVPAALESRIGALESEAGKVTGLTSRVSKLESDVAAAGQAAGTDVSTEVKDLSDRVAKLESDASAAGAATSSAASSALADLEDQVKKLEASVAALTAAGTSTTSGDDALSQTVASLKQQVDEAAKSIGDLQSSLPNLDKLSTEVTALTSQVDELAGRSVDPKAAFVVAVGQLREAADSAEPFDQELAAVEAVAPADSGVSSDIANLKALATGGVPTLADLKASFGAMADDVVAADQAGGDWIDQTLSSLEGLVSVRRVGEVEGDTAEAVVARAESALNEGNLAKAVDDVASLTEAAADAAAGWLAQAKNRLAVDKAVASLSSQASALVTGAAGGGS